MTRDKPNSVNRRVVIDLSWPVGGSVNAGVPSDQYLDTDFVLKLGRGCKIFKVDITRAFRHVPIDPGDLDLLGLHWGDYFIDFLVPFGFKHGSAISLRISDAVHFIMNQEGHGIWNYIDDFLCVSLLSKIEYTYIRLQELKVHKSLVWVFWLIPFTFQFQSLWKNCSYLSKCAKNGQVNTSALRGSYSPCWGLCYM